MKIIFALLTLTVAASSSSALPEACVKRVTNRSISIKGSADAVLGSLRAAKKAGDILDDSDQRIIDAGNTLISAVDMVKSGSQDQLTTFQQGMLSEICEMRVYSSDNISGILEEAAENSRPSQD